MRAPSYTDDESTRLRGVGDEYPEPGFNEVGLKTIIGLNDISVPVDISQHTVESRFLMRFTLDTLESCSFLDCIQLLESGFRLGPETSSQRSLTAWRPISNLTWCQTISGILLRFSKTSSRLSSLFDINDRNEVSVSGDCPSLTELSLLKAFKHRFSRVASKVLFCPLSGGQLISTCLSPCSPGKYFH